MKKNKQLNQWKKLADKLQADEDLLSSAPSVRLDRPRSKGARIERAWHAVRSQPLMETKLAARMIGEGIGNYLPMTKVSFERMRRMVIVSRALFPGIVFVRFKDEEDEGKGFEKLRKMPGFLNMLRMGNPRTGAWAEIEAFAIRALAEQELELSTAREKLKIPYKIGDHVQITGNNAFAGFRSFITDIEADKRITVLLDLFGRKTVVKVDPHEIVPA